MIPRTLHLGTEKELMVGQLPVPDVLPPNPLEPGWAPRAGVDSMEKKFLHCPAYTVLCTPALQIKSEFQPKYHHGYKHALISCMIVSAHYPFKYAACLFYIKTQCIPRCKHSPPRLYETDLLMSYKAKVAVSSEIHTEHINTMWAPRRSFGC
jgi:hypothetical protein